LYSNKHTLQAVAPEAVLQVWRLPCQSEIWYGGGNAAPYQSNEIWAVDSQENH